MVQGEAAAEARAGRRTGVHHGYLAAVPVPGSLINSNCWCREKQLLKRELGTELESITDIWVPVLGSLINSKKLLVQGEAAAEA